MRRTVALGERGRVPFALVGVLLVVASALFAAGIGPHSRPPEPAVDLTMERTAADARTALRQAAISAAVAAASEPVLTPANNSYGSVIGNESAFEDAFRIRVYLAARERFRAIERSHRGITGNVSLPQPTTGAELARAKERVVIAPGNSQKTELRVTIRNVTRTARHGGRVVGQRNETVTVEVDSPVLAVHERVQTFQQRLDAGLLKPGLTQKVTARLYPVAWARGYAQYGGAPIENVVSNQHVSLLTNGAVLGVQRSVFGESDPDGRRAHRAAVAKEALTALTGRAPAPVSPLGELLKQQLVASTPVSEQRGVANLGSASTAPSPNETIEVHVGETAIEAFRPFTCRPGEGSGGRTTAADCTIDGAPRNVLNHTTQRVYSARVRTIAAKEHVDTSEPSRPDPPDAPGDWVLEDADIHEEVVSVKSTGDAPEVSVPEGFHALFTYERRVTVRYSHAAVWHRAANHTVERRTYTNATGTTRVGVAVVGQHAPTRHAPNETIETVHEPYPGAGRNLAGIPERVEEEEVVDDRGGPDAIAGAAALGRLDREAERFAGEPPAGFSRDVYSELAELRREIQDVNVTVERGAVGTYDVNPAAKLAETVRSQRADLAGIPGSYESVAHKARVELRAMYVDRVVAELEARARRHSDQEQGFTDAIASAGGASLGTVRNGLAARRVDTGGVSGGGTAGDLRFRVDGAPPYLTLAEVGHGDVAAVAEGETVFPLKAENVNVFTIPYGDGTKGVVDWVAGALSGDPQTQLRTGAKAMGAAESATEATGNASVAAAKDDLTAQVERSIRTVEVRVQATLEAQGVAETRTQREAIVDAAFARWDDTRARALAVSNRTVVDAVVAEADAHEATNLGPMDRDVLRIRVRNTVTNTLDSKGGTLSGPVVATATEQVRGVVANYTQREVSKAVEKKYNTSISSIPAGLPIAPVPGYWAVTANVWIVNLHGGYERFAVETPRRTPAPGDTSLAYVRDGTNVTLDVDGDGAEELLGRSDEVSFDLQTAIVVVVPAGGTGVGDVGGKLRERSPGWKRLGGGDGNGTRGAAALRSGFTWEDTIQLVTGNGTVAASDGAIGVVPKENGSDGSTTGDGTG